MFDAVYRRLVLLNVGLVTVTVTVVVVAIYILLQTMLEREADHALAERIRVADTIWSQSLAEGLEAAPPVAGASVNHDDGEHHEEDEDGEDDAAHEALETGDTLIFVFDADATLVDNERQVYSLTIPVTQAVEVALSGETDRRIVEVDGDQVRVQTSPVTIDDDVVGAIQAVQSDRDHLAELELVRNMGLVGLGLGIVVAIPAGLFLSRRAMQPLSLAFERQRLFVAEASHELKTPLSLIRANVELITREPEMTTAERQTELRQVLAEIDDMANVVTAMLSLAKLDVAARTGDDRVAALDVVRRLVRDMTPLAHAAGLTLAVDGEEVEVVADEASLRQVLRILIDNAIAYTPPGGHVDVEVQGKRQEVEIRVRDTGLGIPHKDQPLVFDRFYRAEHSRYQHPGGAGLGLSIALATVTALGGGIELESAPEGTTMVVTLPRACRDE